MVDSEILQKPFFTMTGEEILELFGVIAEQKTITKEFTTKNYVYGIKGIQELFQCGRTKAQEIKSSGAIDEAIYQSGNKIIIDADKALQCYQIKSNPK